LRNAPGCSFLPNLAVAALAKPGAVALRIFQTRSSAVGPFEIPGS
jgi:hypothetical protein